MKKLSLVLASASLMVLVSCGGGGTTLAPIEAAKVSALSGSIMSTGLAGVGASSMLKINETYSAAVPCTDGGSVQTQITTDDAMDFATGGTLDFDIDYVGCTETSNVCSQDLAVVTDGTINIKYTLDDVSAPTSIDFRLKGTITFSGAAVEYLDVMDGTTALTSVDCLIDLKYVYNYSSDLDDAAVTGSICGATLDANGDLLDADGAVIDSTDYCPAA